MYFQMLCGIVEEGEMESTLSWLLKDIFYGSYLENLPAWYSVFQNLNFSHLAESTLSYRNLPWTLTLSEYIKIEIDNK